jgi:sortase A
MAGRRFLRWTETLLWWSGALLLGWCAATLAEARVYQVFAGRSLERMREASAKESNAKETTAMKTAASPASRELAPARGDLLGRLEVARLGLSTIVLEGDDARDLRLGVGHIPGTPLPGTDGNSALAGHRDTFLRVLRGIREGDRVDLETPKATYHYVVDFIQVVSPDDVSVLAPASAPALTLVTCYPFSYVGNAPKRFVVRALRVDAPA